ncbi:MAG: hypothetical protein PHX70_05800 [Clostridium sp.]|nr:hypothetical protein [Clostridium sp.]
MTSINKLTRGSIYTALSVVCIYLSSIIPTTKLYVLGIAACVIPISIITTGVRNSLLVYLASSLLSLLIIGLKWNVLAYIILFGSYGFIKFYIEKINKLPIELILKLLFFNISLVVMYFLYKLLFMDVLKLKLPIAAVLVMIQLIFLLCDYAITLFIAYTRKRLKI